MVPIFCLLFLSGTVAALEGPNVCTKEESYPKEVQVPTSVPYEVKTFGWCVKPPTFRCRKTRIAYRSGLKTETRVFTRTVSVCCKGYAESGERCIPICSNACIHGRCSAPEQCECVSGWAGSTCNISCQDGKWGPRCENTCNCRNGTKCDAETGKCVCPPGATGSDCVFPCNCYHEATCNRLNGRCECGPGYMGSMCEAQCPTNRYGKDCAFYCSCNGGSCSFITGECFCLPGYSGVNCEIRNCSMTEEGCTENTLQYSASPVEEKSNGLVLIACICSLSIIILVISVFALLKYKQRVHQLKHELAYVTYIADKPKDSFNNPVYDCQPEASNKQQMAIAVNPGISSIKTIKNDLDCKNNIQKAKLDDEYLGACGGHPDDFSHKDANLNANIYHNIDDFKSYKEPLYDEIKLKGIDEENDNYDHLQYDRPRTLVRPNYDYIDNLKQV